MDAFRSAADSGSAKLFSSYQTSADAGNITTVRDFTSTQMADLANMSANADTATNDLLLDAADTLADIDERALGLCAVCAPGKPVAPPDALSAGAGAASMNNLIARPVSQARSDIGVAQAARIKALQDKAQKHAGEIPQITPGTDPTVTGVTGTTGQAGEPLKSTITPDGHLLPSISSGAAVKDLVTGVTGPLNQATGGATAPLTDPLDDAVDKLGDAATDLLP
jgi:hypothetical protein